MTKRLPTLVECPPYSTQLSTAACVRRFELANGMGPAPKSKATGHHIPKVLREDMRISSCRGCRLGRARTAEVPGGR